MLNVLQISLASGVLAKIKDDPQDDQESEEDFDSSEQLNQEDEPQDDQESEEAFEEEDMLPRDLNNSTAFDFEHRPATKPLDVMTEAVFKGDETDFGQALHKIHKKVKIKGATMKIPEINVNVRSVKVNNPRAGKEKGRDETHLAIVHFSLNDDDIPLVTLNFWDSKKGYTLSLKKTT